MSENVNGSGGKVGNVLVWDLPTRIFHWGLVAAIVTSLLSEEFGNMDIHVISGHVVLALVLFRICWGVVGGRHARFADFVKGPAAVMAYAKGLLAGKPEHYRGHNPMGALSVLAILAVVAVQATTGLFASDDILTEGPLVKLVSGSTSSLMTEIHEIGSTILYWLIGLHLAAIAFYTFKGEKLIKAMVDGRKEGIADETATGARGNLFVAIVLIAIAGAVAYVVFNY